MINTTEPHQSNSASIPPPRRAIAFRKLSRFEDEFLHASTTLRAKGRKEREVSYLIRWTVPPRVAVCLANSLSNRWESYRKQLRQCQSEFSETSVHQLRVATRRLMTHYVLVDRTVSGEKVSKARKKLKRHLKVLGELRDVQVQRIFIEQQTIRFPFLVLLLDFLKRRERRLVKDVARKIHRFKSQKLEQWTLNLCQELASRSEGSEKQELLATDVFSTIADAFAEAASRRQSIDPANPQTIHRTRVAFKKFRYMVEAVSPSFTGLGKRQLRRLGNYQRRMGALQDLEILEACLHEFLREHAWAIALFTPFTSYLRRRRGRTLRLCLKRASDLFEFWDPSANLESNRR